MPVKLRFGWGTNCERNVLAYGAIRLAGMIFPAKGRRVVGSIIIAFEPAKLPVRYAMGGTCTWFPNVPDIWRPDSQLKKKKVRLRPSYNFGNSTGPPRLAPNWFRFRRGGLTPGTRGWKALSAVNASLRLNSQAVP